MEQNIIGISQGDCNGTSYEIMLKTFQESRFQNGYTTILYGSPKIAAYYRKTLNINNFSFNPADNADAIQIGKANLINVLDDSAKVELGSVTQASAEAAAVSLQSAVNDLSNNRIDALVLNPLPQAALSVLQVANQFDYVKQQLEVSNTMTLLVNDSLRVALLTDARPMRNIAKSLSVDNIVNKLHLLNNSLKADFAIDKPRIAVLGYNPNCANAENREHEESDVIIPAVGQANNEGVLALGPFDAEEVFGTDLFKKFDAILAIYYTQGVAPFRALSYDDGVSYLLGVRQMCVEPLQSLGYQQAGADVAKPIAFQKAMYLISEVNRNRIQYEGLISNQLKTNQLTE